MHKAQDLKATAKALALMAKEHASAHRAYVSEARKHFVAKRYSMQRMFQRRAYHEAQAAYHYINQSLTTLKELHHGCS